MSAPASSRRWPPPGRRATIRCRTCRPSRSCGYPDFTAKVWFGLLVKEGTPPDVVKRLTDAAKAAHADPAIRQKLEAQGFEVSAETGPQLKTEIKAQGARWGRLVKASGISVEDRGSTK